MNTQPLLYRLLIVLALVAFTGQTLIAKGNHTHHTDRTTHQNTPSDASHMHHHAAMSMQTNTTDMEADVNNHSHSHGLPDNTGNCCDLDCDCYTTNCHSVYIVESYRYPLTNCSAQLSAFDSPNKISPATFAIYRPPIH